MRALFVVLALVLVGIALLDGRRKADTAAEESDAPTLAEMAADVDHLYQITDVPFRMNREFSGLCLPALDDWPGADGSPPKNAAPKDAGPHSDYYCHIFINDLGLPTMKTGKGEYPIGTVIVKQKFYDPEGTRTEFFTLMRKREDGYDPDNGNWEYSTVDQTATKILSRGRTESCIGCHSDYTETDYVTRTYLNPK